MTDKKSASFGVIVGIIGAILIAVGVFWLIAQNWHDIADPLKIIILVLFTAAAFTAGVLLKIKGYKITSHVLFILGSLLYTASIFLIAQIFNVDASLQGNAYLMLLAWIGVVVAAYIFDSAPSLVIGMAEFFNWISLQYFAFVETGGFRSVSFTVIVLLYLATGVLLYGLYLIHKTKILRFARVYQWWTAAYFLLFGYLLSFQSFLPFLSFENRTDVPSATIFMIVIALIAIATFFAGIIIATSKKSITTKELIGIGTVIILLLILILVASAVPNKAGSCSAKYCGEFNNQETCLDHEATLGCEWQTNEINQNAFCSLKDGTVFGTLYQEASKECRQYNNQGDKCRDREEICNWYPSNYYDYGGGNNAPLDLWLLWLFSNLIFLGLILAIIFYGTWQGLPKIVNLGIVFFVLDVISRYIGFLMDFGGYMGFAGGTILTGILLVFGSWGIEKWRRKMVRKARKE
ncbi:DUF2157 domain-containing protein [Candidatus Woesearchaeota archaeon]|nr:DUF2157 domain-containing protein [Candidatus Woesearchaeota archaeon]